MLPAVGCLGWSKIHTLPTFTNKYFNRDVNKISLKCICEVNANPLRNYTSYVKRGFEFIPHQSTLKISASK